MKNTLGYTCLMKDAGLPWATVYSEIHIENAVVTRPQCRGAFIMERFEGALP